MRAIVLWAAVAAGLLALPAAGRADSVPHENLLPGSSGWRAPEADPSEIAAYASEVSALPGATLHFHVSSPYRYRIVVYRLGWYGGAGGRVLGCVPGCDRDRQGAGALGVPAPDPRTGLVVAGWPVTDTFTLDPSLPSGYVMAQFLLTSGPDAGRTAATWVIVREPPGQSSAVLVQVPVNTWQAYNDWGGKSLYGFNSTDHVAADHVSFQRPYAPSTASGAQGPARWELPLVRFLEQEGLDVSYQTDADTDRDPGSLLRHRLVMTAGHGEYWTKAERDAFDFAVASGTNLAFMGANTGYWQVRYEDGGSTLVGYKGRAATADPVTDPELRTDLFRSLSPPRWECMLEGVQHQGGPLTWPVDDYTVAAPAGDPWLAGTGLAAGDRIRGIASVERDTVPSFSPPGTACGHPATVLFRVDRGGEYAGDGAAVRYTSVSGARVFAAGSLQFAWGLSGSPVDDTPADPRLQAFVRNVIADLLRPALPAVSVSAGRAVVTLPGLDPRVQTVLVAGACGGSTGMTLPPAATTADGLTQTFVVPAGTECVRAVARDAWSSVSAAAPCPQGQGRPGGRTGRAQPRPLRLH